MKTIEEFLSDLRRRDINLWIDGNDLCYKAPSQTLIPALRQELKERKAEILTFLHNANAATHSNLPPILPAPRDKDFPLSFAQQRLWFLDQLEPNSSAYNMPAAYRLTGQLNITALEQSLNEIIQRHEILRTIFPSVDGQPSQAIAPTITLTLPLTDLREHPETEREVICASQQRNALAQQIANEEAQQPFNLATEPLFRVKLLRLAETEYVLLLNMHHIISDGWSFDVFFRELAALYTAFSTNKLSALPSLPIQYADFAVWQREWLSGKVLESQLNYWKQQLSSHLPVLQLPTDSPRPPIQTYQGAYQSLELPLDLTEALKALSQQERVTLFMTLLAAFQTLLFRYSGQEDIIVGTPIAGRNQVETEGLIGFFVNTLALRTHLDGNPTFQELLSRVREVALGAYAHQDLPFEKLVEELQPQRDRSRTPLVQVMFALQNTSMSALELPGLTINSLSINSGTAKFDLTLAVRETTQRLVASFEYNTDLFAATTITRMLGHFQTLLEGIIANPQQRLWDLPLLTAAERHQLLVEWNNTKTDYAKDKCIHQLFEEQVERTPDAVAVVFEQEQLTYRELNAKANQLAHYLRKLGVKSEVLVGICVERSVEMIVGLLGILKAGGAYVPLDPDYPTERLTFLLEDTQVPVLLTQQSLLEKLPSNKAYVLCLDTEEIISRQNEDDPTPNTTADNLAHIIYTSGSTGKPKGVITTHSNVVRLFEATRSWFNFNGRDVWTLFHSYAFDFSVWEIWGAFFYGGRLVIVPFWITRSPNDFYKLLCSKQVTILNQTPSAFRQLIHAEEQASTPAKSLALRLVIFGGEALDLGSLKPWFERHGDEYPQLVNMYGITETTVHVTYRPITRSDVEAVQGSPIGRPIPDLQIYLLNRHLNPVPIGVPGEIHVGGDGLARGYLNRSELTQEKFIPNPFSDEPTSRLYKTGDLARYLPDGNIEFLGRLDNQVKIRGFRIELGEIEAVLAQYSTVQQTVVTAREDMLGGKRLVAYVVPNQEQVPTVDELRRFLKQKLPSYMVPSTFVLLDTLPLTPSGKVDRRVLPAPDQLRQEPEETFVASQDELELQLTKIWEKVLGIQPIGVTDNFFDLGGHSLLAVRLFAQIEKTFGKNLPLATLFQAATVAALASIIRQEEWIAPWSSLMAIQSGGSKPPLFCMHAGGGNLLVYRDLACYLGEEQPVYGLQARGMDGKLDPMDRIEDMAVQYLAQIRTIQPNGPYFLTGLSVGGTIAWEIAQRLHAQGQKVALLALFDSNGPGYPKVLPPIPRLLSVLQWSIFDYGRWPVKLVDKLIQLGIKETWLKILERLGIVERRLDDDQRTQALNVQGKLRRSIDKYRCHSSNISYLEKGINSLIIFLLKNSSKSYYANIFTGSLERSTISFLPEALQKVEEANRKAKAAYVQQVYPGRVILFRASERPPGIYRDPELGLSGMAAEGIEIYEIPGDHTSIVKSPVLGEKLRACLDKAQTYDSGVHHP